MTTSKNNLHLVRKSSGANFVILKGKNEEILNTIEANRDADSFFIKRKISNKILYLMLKTTSVKRIRMTSSIARVLPKKTVYALKKVGVKIEILPKQRRGRKRKYGYDVVLAARRAKHLAKLSLKKGIPLRTLYYYKAGRKTTKK